MGVMQDKSAVGGGFTLRVAASFNTTVERFAYWLSAAHFHVLRSYLHAADLVIGTKRHQANCRIAV